VPCPKGKKLKASHGKLGDLVSRYVPSWLPDNTAELLDDVVSEVSECIQCCDHLVVIEGFRRSLAEEKDSFEHVHSGLADSCLEESRFPLRVTCIFSVIVIVVFDRRFIRVNAHITPHLSDSFQGFKLSARHQSFLHVLRAHPPSCHCKALSQVNVERRKSSVGQLCNRLSKVDGCAIGHRGSVLAVAQQSSQCGSNKLN
jgi:hypothetical protein